MPKTLKREFKFASELGKIIQGGDVVVKGDRLIITHTRKTRGDAIVRVYHVPLPSGDVLLEVDEKAEAAPVAAPEKKTRKPRAKAKTARKAKVKQKDEAEPSEGQPAARKKPGPKPKKKTTTKQKPGPKPQKPDARKKPGPKPKRGAAKRKSQEDPPVEAPEPSATEEAVEPEEKPTAPSRPQVKDKPKTRRRRRAKAAPVAEVEDESEVEVEDEPENETPEPEKPKGSARGAATQPWMSDDFNDDDFDTL